jgi:hypothetical protein
MIRCMLVFAVGLLMHSRCHAGDSAFVCRSNKSDWMPQLGPNYHSSIAICPAGVSPTLQHAGCSYSNPGCSFFGTQPGSNKFQNEPYRYGVTCRPTQAPLNVVRQRMESWDRAWAPWNNCQHATSWVER